MGHGEDRGASVIEQCRGPVLVITINRPHVRNAVNSAVTDGVGAALDELDTNDGLSVGVLTGAGGYFCAGLDLGAFLAGERPWDGERGFAGVTRKAPRKPLIAAVEGGALAGGFEVVLACDLIVAARGAQFGIPEVKRSLVAAGGGLLRLPRRMPYHAAMQMALTGAPLDAERLQELGVVSAVTEPGRALEASLRLAESIAANGPLAVLASKRIIQAQADWATTEMWERQAEISDPVLVSEDAREGAVAFKERRAPVWHGR
jgi:enoyl-CoA hydratase